MELKPGMREYCAEQLSDAISAAALNRAPLTWTILHPATFLTSKWSSLSRALTETAGHPLMQRLAALLENETLDLSGLKYAICGLGYLFDHFAQCGKDFDKTLQKSSAMAMFERVDCDTDYEYLFEQFQESAVNYLTENKATLFSTASSPAAPPPLRTEAVKTGYSRDRPFPAPLRLKKLLSGSGSAKETMHYEIDLTGSDLGFRAGDCFGVYPTNPPNEVQAILDHLKASGDESVVYNGESISFRSALQRACLQRITKDFIKALAAFPGNQNSPASTVLRMDQAGLDNYRNSRHVIDTLPVHQTAGFPPQTFVDNLRKMQPRLYSVASSPTADPNKVAFVIETLRYKWNGRDVEGVASCWFADQVSADGTVPVYLVKNDDFQFPNDETPVIMIGPGTGIAPFRAHLAEMAATGNQAKTWLFFGHQHEDKDFLYRDELQGFLALGVLNRANYAWSRDQDHKIYVQDRILENGKEVWEWMQQGAKVYVCGDAKGMAPGVANAFSALASTHGGVDGDAWLQTMISTGRYLTDVY